MPKMLITDSTLVNFRDDRGGVHAEKYEIHDVPKDVAADLVNAGRALYVDAKDDPSKGNFNTASVELLKAAEAAVKAKKSKPAAGSDGSGGNAGGAAGN